MRMLQFRRRNPFAERQLELLQIKLPSWTANFIDSRQDSSVGWSAPDRTKRQPERVAVFRSMHRTRFEEVMSVVGVPKLEASVCVCVCVCVSCEWNPGSDLPPELRHPPSQHEYRNC